MKVRLPKFECLRCGHKWAPRVEEKPLRCAFCKSPYWERPMSDKESVRLAQHDQDCVGCRARR